MNPCWKCVTVCTVRTIEHLAETGRRQRAREAAIPGYVRCDLIAEFDDQDDTLYVWADFEYPKGTSKASASMRTVSEIGIVEHETGQVVMDLREVCEDRRTFVQAIATMRAYLAGRKKSRLAVGFYSIHGIDLAFMRHLFAGLDVRYVNLLNVNLLKVTMRLFKNCVSARSKLLSMDLGLPGTFLGTRLQTMRI